MPLLNTIIVLWSGAIVDIPDGWALCDGNNDLPDLRNKFVVCAGDTYAISDTGGVTQHKHTFSGDGHVHSLPAGAQVASGADLAHPSALNHIHGHTNYTATIPPYYALAFIGKI